MCIQYTTHIDVLRHMLYLTASREGGAICSSMLWFIDFKVTGYSRGRAHALQLRLRNESFTLRRFGFILHALCTSVRL